MEDEINNDSDNSWTDVQEELIKKWYKESMGFYWKHNKIARKYSYRDKLIGLPATVANAIAGTVIFSNLEDTGNCENNLYIQLGVGGVILFVTILFAIQNFLNLSQLSEKHTNSASKYKSLANSLEAELSLPRNDRLNGKIFLKQAQKRFNELLEICPNLPESIDKLYKEELENNEDIDFLKEIIIDKSESKDDKNKLKKSESDNDIYNSDNDENDSLNSNSEKTLQQKLDEEIRNMNLRENLKNIQNKRRMSRFIDASYE